MPAQKIKKQKKGLTVLIINDMEGISGIDHWHQIFHGFEEFEEFGRVQVTEDVNATIRGLRAAGATDIRVADSHGSGGSNKNIIPEQLEKGVMLFQEKSIPKRMTEAIDKSVDAAVFVGFHAMAGTKDGLFRHTITLGPTIKVNGEPVGETALDAYILAEYGIPVIMATGDQALVREASDILPGIETAQVKTSVDAKTTECLPLLEARSLIQEAACRALSRVDEFEPVQIAKPIKVDVSFPTEEQVDLCDTIPRAERTSKNTTSFTTSNWDEAYGFIRTTIGLTSPRMNAHLIEKLLQLPGADKVRLEWTESLVNVWLS
ncbi:MAG: M55 family metallopeptidase [Candidatus Thorarchaeota archaeon]|nr:MAG: M55 family metallopeptidase [Candidatus Thorarchaeota archaeon]